MPKQPRAAATRQKLIDAAVGLFAAEGYSDTTPKDIATAADLTPGAFYYHFKSKEDLAVEIIDQGWPGVAHMFSRHLIVPESGMRNVIGAAFALIDLLNTDKGQWVSFHLDMAIGHRSQTGRMAYRQRVETFSTLVPNAFQDSEVRETITRQEAAELLWIALVGTQLMSDALGETGAAPFLRLALAWKSALRSIVPDSMLTGFEEFVDETAARYAADLEPALRRPA